MAFGSVDALIGANRKQPNLRNRVEAATEILGEAKVLIEQWRIHFSITLPHQGLGWSM